MKTVCENCKREFKFPTNISKKDLIKGNFYIEATPKVRYVFTCRKCRYSIKNIIDNVMKLNYETTKEK